MSAFNADAMNEERNGHKNVTEMQNIINPRKF